MNIRKKRHFNKSKTTIHADGGFAFVGVP